MQSENAFKLGSILLLVGFSIAGANVTGNAVGSIRSESSKVTVQAENPVRELYQAADIRKEVEEVQEINKMNVTEFAPYKIR